MKENVDINGLFSAVGTEFLKLVKILRLHHKFEDEISSSTINRMFKSLLDVGSDFARIDALEFASLLLSYKRVDLFTPFVDGSLRLVDVLKHILGSESKIALEIFFQMLSNDVKRQVLQMLKSTNVVTGLLNYPWGLVESQNLRERVVSDDRETVDIAINELDLDQKLVVDSVARLLYVVKYFKKLGFDSPIHRPTLLSIYFESDVFVISNDKITFAIDMMVNDVYYQSALYDFISSLWSSRHFVKVGHNIMLNIAMLSCRFNKSFSEFSNLVDLNEKRIKKVLCNVSQVHDSSTRLAEEEERTIFKPTGYTKKLFGLLQEYNIPVFPRSRRWNGKHRPICAKRIQHLVNVSKGILHIEHTLRNDGWLPSMICDSSSTKE